jgi:hypothetical protein
MSSSEALPAMSSWAELERVLRDELGYCGCGAYVDSVHLLRDVLSLTRERSAATADLAAFSSASRALEARLQVDTAPGLATWFLHVLDHHGLISHGLRATDAWITDRGQQLLDALERFPVP